MICVKFTAFCDLRADLQIRLATLRKSVRKFWFCKHALTCVDLRVRLANAKKLLQWRYNDLADLKCQSKNGFDFS